MRLRRSSFEPSIAIASILVPPRSTPIRMKLQYVRALSSLLAALLHSLSKKRIEIQWVGHCERDVAVCIARPLGLRAIARQLDPVAVEVCQIDRLADAVIRDALNPDACIDHAMHRAGKISSRRVEDGEMVKAGVVRRRGSAAPALPRVETNMMMVPTGR